MEYVTHLDIILKGIIIKIKYLLIVFVLMWLVEYAEHLIQTIVYSASEKRNLYDDAIMHKTIDEWVRNTLGHLNAIIVVWLVINIKHRLLNIANPMT